MFVAIKILISAIVIATSTEVAKRNPSVGGLILALPIVSIIAFAFMGYQGTEPSELSSYAKSTLIFIPVSLVFFLPFVIPSLQSWSFLYKFSLGIFTLTILNLVIIKTNLIKF